MRQPQKPLAMAEFVALLALLISLVALSIDAMLPALPQIGASFGVVGANDTQQVISALFFGLAVGQLIYGPVSDSVGRKPPIYFGLALFLVGCLLSLLASDYHWMLVGRFLQGLGAAASRIVSIALVRDQFEGRAMARIMSLIMAVFITVPALAPAVGQGILLVAHWRAIFALFAAMAVIGFVWFFLRQPETLPSNARRPLSLPLILRAALETLCHRQALSYIIAAGLIFGAFIGYLTSAQQIFHEIYQKILSFPFYFAILALMLGAASILNARLVMRFGMSFMCWCALAVLASLSPLAFFLFWLADGQPALHWFMAWALVAFFCMGILFGNFNAMAMEPLGHIAGVAAAVIGFVTSVISVFTGALIGQLFDGTVLPLLGGFAVLSLGSVAAMAWAGRQG